MSEYLSGAKIMAFVSDLDKFLQKLDKRFPQKSASQQKVIKQYQRNIEGYLEFISSLSFQYLVWF
jgi:hypothetical protein